MVPGVAMDAGSKGMEGIIRENAWSALGKSQESGGMLYCRVASVTITHGVYMLS